MKKRSGIIMCFILTCCYVFPQRSLLLVSVKDTTHQKKISLEKILDYRAIDGTRLYFHAVGVEPGNLMIEKQKCVVEKRRIYLNAHKTDSTYNTYTTCVTDTVRVPFDSIGSINYMPNVGKRWPVYFAIFSFMSIASVISIPLNAINHHGHGEVLTNTAICGVLLTLSVPPALVGLRTKKYDTRNKWNLRNYE